MCTHVGVKASRSRSRQPTHPSFVAYGCGVSSLVIVELKRPGIPIGTEQTEQVWTYVKELRKLGFLTASTQVTGFVLGSAIAPYEDEDITRGQVSIQPMLYDTFLGRAKKRMLTLHDKLIETPMMQAAIKEFAAVPALPQEELDFAPKVEVPRASRKKAAPAKQVPDAAPTSTHEHAVSDTPKSLCQSCSRPVRALCIGLKAPWTRKAYTAREISWGGMDERLKAAFCYIVVS